jgi:hypothetical protein
MLFLTLASVFVTLPTHAQEGPPPPVYLQAPPPPGVVYVQAPPPRVPDAKRLYDSGVRLRGVGKPLTIAGAIAIPAGIILIIGGEYACSASGFNTGACGAAIGLYALGSIAEIAGWPMLGGGIALWVIGNHRIDQAHELGYNRTVSLLPSLHLDPRGQASGSLALVLQF